MTSTSGSRPPGGSAAWASWVAFAGIMLMLIGVFSVIAGLAAVSDDGSMVRNVHGEVFLLSFKVVGFIWILLGVLKVWVGWALIQGRSWARFAAIFLIAFHTIIDLLTVTARPFLSLLFIGVSFAILYGLTVRWDDARVGLGD